MLLYIILYMISIGLLRNLNLGNSSFSRKKTAKIKLRCTKKIIINSPVPISDVTCKCYLCNWLKRNHCPFSLLRQSVCSSLVNTRLFNTTDCGDTLSFNTEQYRYHCERDLSSIHHWFPIQYRISMHYCAYPPITDVQWLREGKWQIKTINENQLIFEHREL